MLQQLTADALIYTFSIKITLNIFDDFCSIVKDSLHWWLKFFLAHIVHFYDFFE